MTPRVTVVIPAYNEGDGVIPVLARIGEAVTLPAEMLVVVDSADDTTIPAVERARQSDARVRWVLNTYGRGPANAIKFGIAAAAAPVVVVTMADGCDDPSLLPLDEVIARSDVLVIGAPHPAYRSLSTDKAVVDVWNLRSEGVLL